MNPPKTMTLIEIAEAIVREAKAEMIWPMNSSCGKGCGACCRQLVTVSPGEALRIADFVARMPTGEKERIGARFEEAEHRIDAAGLIDPLNSLQHGETEAARHFEVARAYFELQLACPFLENESCAIHEARPVICREYHVASHPSKCGDPFGHTVDVIAPAKQRDAAHKLLDAHLMDSEVTPVPLALALRWARKNSDVGGLQVDEGKFRSLWERYQLMCGTADPE